MEYNRYLNGSVNIGNRLLGYMLRSRADVNQLQTPPLHSTPNGDQLAIQSTRREAHLLVGE